MSLLDEERLKRDLNDMIMLVGRNGRINDWMVLKPGECSNLRGVIMLRVYQATD